MSLTQYLSYALIAVGVITGYMAVVGMFRKDRNQSRAERIDAVFDEKEQARDGTSSVAVVLGDVRC